MNAEQRAEVKRVRKILHSLLRKVTMTVYVTEDEAPVIVEKMRDLFVGSEADLQRKPERISVPAPRRLRGHSTGEERHK